MAGSVAFILCLACLTFAAAIMFVALSMKDGDYEEAFWCGLAAIILVVACAVLLLIGSNMPEEQHDNQIFKGTRVPEVRYVE